MVTLAALIDVFEAPSFFFVCIIDNLDRVGADHYCGIMTVVSAKTLGSMSTTS